MFFSSAARILSANAIPTVYEGLGVTGIAFGENAYALTDECFENGLIIDLLAAKILSDRGIDVGIESFGAKTPIRFQYIPDDDNELIAQNVSVFDIKTNEKSQIISLSSQVLEEASLPFCYRYQNEKGQKFLVFNCIAKDCEMHLKHYANAKIIADNAEWLSGNKLPAFCYGYPNLYMQCKEDADSTVIGVWNFFEDEATQPVIQLGQNYQNAEFICGSGTLCSDTVRLNDIPPYGFCGIVLKK